jgi:hypothetical protein
LDLENPYSHVKKFKDICTTFKFQKFSEESVHLRLFPFSLHDRAKAWLDSNMPGSNMTGVCSESVVFQTGGDNTLI